jgi:hypothetical protein
MKLKRKVKNLDEVPENLRSLYVQSGDEYVLEVEDDESASLKTKVSEFRDNNIKLNNEINDLKAKLEKYKNIDPSKAEDALARLQEIEDKKLIEEGKIDELLEQRITSMKSSYEGQIQSLQEKITNMDGSLGKYRNLYSNGLTSNVIQEAISEVAVPRKGAMKDILRRASEVFTLNDEDKLVPMADGKVIYGKDGNDPLSPTEWIANLYTEAPYFFEPNSGGGANGSDKKGLPKGASVSSEDINSLQNNLEAIAEGTVNVE